MLRPHRVSILIWLDNLYLKRGRYFYCLDLPDDVIDDPAVKRLDKIARELIVMYINEKVPVQADSS